MIRNVRLMLRGLNVDKRAVTAIEYALIASLIAVALVTVLGTMSNSIISTFNIISNDL